MTRFRVKVRQELVYEIEAADEDAAWRAVDEEHFGDPAECIGYDHPDVIYVREDDR